MTQRWFVGCVLVMLGLIAFANTTSSAPTGRFDAEIQRFDEADRKSPELDRVTGCPRIAVVAEIEEREPARHHTDDRIGLAGPTQSKFPSDHCWIPAVTAAATAHGSG
jgi:hypothetical protein